MNSIRGKYEGNISLLSTPARTPTLSFTVGQGQVFRGTISVMVYCSAGGTPTVSGLYKDGNLSMIFGPKPATTSGAYHAETVYVELPPGSYYLGWEVESGGGSNKYAINGCLYRA